MSNYSDESDDNADLMNDNDPKNQKTCESIIERLIRSFVSDDYGEADYWNQRYDESPDEYEWFMSWKHVYPIVSQFCTKGNALNLGCGNSPMPVEMLETGFSTVVNVDFSDILIEQMKEKYKNINNLEWMTMDCTELRFGDEFFDNVVEKGLFDALYCSSNSANLISKTMKEVERVLKTFGCFIVISFGDQKSREQIIKFEGNLKFINSFEISNPHNEEAKNYIYIFQKK